MNERIKILEQRLGRKISSYIDSRGIERIDLRGADFTGANFHCAYLPNADFTGANLRGVDFTDAYLAGADFTDADLTNANLIRACLRGVDFTGADLTGAKIEGAKNLVIKK